MKIRFYNKYKNTKTTVDNIVFASKAEAGRYCELKLLEKAGEITDLKIQPKFELLEAFFDVSGNYHRSIYYIADFAFLEGDWHIVEDVKGMKTDVYKLKKKLFLYKNKDIIFREI